MKMSSWCFFCRSKAPAWSLHAQLGAGEGAPSLFPVPAERGGEAAKQRAPEPPLFPHLSLAGASMKIWCIFKGDTAIKWRELLVVKQPSLLVYVAHNIFWGNSWSTPC
jgi:hypothetical protein